MAGIAAIDYELPERVSRTREWAADVPDWPVEKIIEKLGIDELHVAGANECASDLAVRAAEKLFTTGRVERKAIDYLIFLTQTPDYILPTTACLLQDRLNLSNDTGALDINLGCSGYVYGLGLAHGLIATGQATNVLLLTADTYSKLVHPMDRTMRALLGDAATATLLTREAGEMGPFVFGTDGKRAMHIAVPAGGMRQRVSDGVLRFDDKGNGRTDAHVHMDGRGMFSFSSEVVPLVVEKTLRRAGCTADDIDLFFFHQSNKRVIEHVVEKMNLPPANVVLDMRDCGSTGSSSIPVTLSRAIRSGRLKHGMKILLVGYGVGLSWCACTLTWGANK